MIFAGVCPPIKSTETLSVKCTTNGVPLENCESATEGTLANYKCASFYESQKSIDICKDGSWDQTRPSCVPGQTPIVINLFININFNLNLNKSLDIDELHKKLSSAINIDENDIDRIIFPSESRI